MKNEIKHTTHSTYRCQYHIVFAPKYRRKAIYGQLKADIGQILRKLCERMGLVCVNSKHILIVALQKSVTQFLTDLQGLFGCNFIGSETLDYVVCEDLCSPCSDCSDCSEVGGSTSAVGSAGIRLHI